MPSSPDVSDGAGLFLEALPLIDAILLFLGRRHRCRGHEAEDFASWVRLRLIEKDYSILRRFRGQSTLRSYLSVVIQRLLVDFRRQRWGVWRPSASARRLGETATRLDRLLHRDGLSLGEAIEALRTSGQAPESEAELRELAAQLPAHVARRTEGEERLARLGVSGEALVEKPALAGERAQRAWSLHDALQSALRELPPEDSLIVRLRFVEGFTAARVAEILGVPTKPFYRRQEGLLAKLRAALASAGFEASDLADLLGSPAFDGDERGAWQEGDPGPSKQVCPPSAATDGGPQL
jgi:RNA polymerase sigma factor (sigma-70 family)